ncbi:hypothetical protein BCR32DRAFT_287881 [Anaeromyces robustus]|uniref:Uncharacterized protein n=1 Tax=Anaeromyces robustus TaxID=1754192 RepID=A0A1Y1VQF6_9FUNG|nr:hypothetical protein BCR32DRAFT_287881 [Anaeromyces robustus]|eukprot:ORX63285.1 hypothetical protein BCR32DRAFT_287881 [Anaeromyces robustus]
MPKKERNNNSKKRKFSEEEEEDIEDLNLNTYKKKKFNGNRKNIKYNDNEDFMKLEKLEIFGMKNPTFKINPS